MSTATAPAPPPESRHRTLTHEIPRAASLATPAVRIVCVHAWAWTEGGEMHSGHAFYPVVAIKTSVVDRYTIDVPEAADPPASGASHREVIGRGWRHSARDVRDDLMIVREDFGLCDAESALDSCNSEWRPVACPWPPDQDAENLAPVVAELLEAAAKRDGARREFRRPDPITTTENASQ